MDRDYDFTRDEFYAVIQQMITEQGASSWIHTEGLNRAEMHDAVVVTNDPGHCFRLVCPDPSQPNIWHIHHASLDSGELADFFAAFGNHWSVLLNAAVGTPPTMPVRAFIKNGRKKGRGWSISIDVSAKQEAPPERLVIDKTKRNLTFENETEAEVTLVIRERQ